MLRFFRLSSKDLPLLVGGLIVWAIVWAALEIYQDSVVQHLGTFDLSFLDGRMILLFFVLFFVVIRLLDALVMTPYIAFYEHREAATEGRMNAAVELESQTAEVLAEIDALIAQARVNAYREKNRILQGTKQRAQKVIAAAESEAAVLLADERRKIASDADQSRQKLSKEIDLIAASLAAQVEGALQGAQHK